MSGPRFSLYSFRRLFLQFASWLPCLLSVSLPAPSLQISLQKSSWFPPQPPSLWWFHPCSSISTAFVLCGPPLTSSICQEPACLAFVSKPFLIAWGKAFCASVASHTYIHTCMHIFIHACIYTYIHARIHTCVCVCICIYTHAHT